MVGLEVLPRSKLPGDGCLTFWFPEYTLTQRSVFKESLNNNDDFASGKSVLLFATFESYRILLFLEVVNIFGTCVRRDSGKHYNYRRNISGKNSLLIGWNPLFFPFSVPYPHLELTVLSYSHWDSLRCFNIPLEWWCNRIVILHQIIGKPSETFGTWLLH